MEKIVFSDNTEIQISGITQAKDVLTITIDTSNMDFVISKFRDKSITDIMRYYAGTDLIRGYSGFTNLQSVLFNPDVIISIDYEKIDKTTKSGFSESVSDRCIIKMVKIPLIVSVSNQTAINTANIDYLSMETGIEL